MTPASREWQRHKAGVETLVVYLMGLGAAMIMAALLVGCVARWPTLDGCDAEIAHQELIACVTDAAVPEGPEQTAQVVTWCSARAALKACQHLRTGALRQGLAP